MVVVTFGTLEVMFGVVQGVTGALFLLAPSNLRPFFFET